MLNYVTYPKCAAWELGMRIPSTSKCAVRALRVSDAPVLGHQSVLSESSELRWRSPTDSKCAVRGSHWRQTISSASSTKVNLYLPGILEIMQQRCKKHRVYQANSSKSFEKAINMSNSWNKYHTSCDKLKNHRQIVAFLYFCILSFFGGRN